jgi:hypothetical protein
MSTIWQYKTVSTDMSSQELNEVGLAGWELVSVVQFGGAMHNSQFFRHFFKRKHVEFNDEQKLIDEAIELIKQMPEQIRLAVEQAQKS